MMTRLSFTSQDARGLRVRATDRTVFLADRVTHPEAVSERVLLDQPPEVRFRIRPPTCVEPGESIFVEGIAHDPEGGPLFLEWSLDGTPIGTGDHVDFQAPTTRGRHELSLCATERTTCAQKRCAETRFFVSRFEVVATPRVVAAGHVATEPVHVSRFEVRGCLVDEVDVSLQGGAGVPVPPGDAQLTIGGGSIGPGGVRRVMLDGSGLAFGSLLSANRGQVVTITATEVPIGPRAVPRRAQAEVTFAAPDVGLTLTPLALVPSPGVGSRTMVTVTLRVGSTPVPGHLVDLAVVATGSRCGTQIQSATMTPPTKLTDASGQMEASVRRVARSWSSTPRA